MSFGEKVISFLSTTKIVEKLPDGVEILDPYAAPAAMDLTSRFYRKFYSDNSLRTFLIGINPGRFGGGATGIAFTDPVNLSEKCGIDNDLDKRHELSSRFIYSMIDAFGGPHEFYNQFYFTSVSPLGFVQNGKNLNYYDLPELQKILEPYMVDSLKTQISFGSRPVAYSLGRGKNIAYLSKINDRYNLFKDIRPLPHPRWVMQYRLKRLEEFIELYRNELADHLHTP